MTHPSPAVLAALAQGQEPTDGVEGLRAHLVECTQCAIAFQEALSRRFDVAGGGGETVEVASRPSGPSSASSPLAPAPPVKTATLNRGETVGRYVIVNSIGAGGMGVVYLAYDPELDRRVAIKLLRPDRGGSSNTTGSESGRQRLLREAQALAKLAHPNVVAVFDAGVFHESIFMAMEFVPGDTLGQWLKAQKRPWQDVVARMVQAGRGLAAAHAAGMIHRDFKPGNILLGEDGRVRVTDFGLARAAGARDNVPITIDDATGDKPVDAFSSDLTQAGAVVGTVGYMAPEQVTQDVPVDGRADQFAFALTLFEGLYGFRAFGGDTAAAVTTNLLKNHMRPLPKDTTVPAWVHRVILKALSPKPDQRYPSMDELLVALSNDPRANVRKAAPWVIGGALLAGAFIGNTVVQRNRASTCEGDERVFAGVWDSKVQQHLKEVFEGSHKPFAAAALASIEHRLNDFVSSWKSARRDACEATLVRNEQPKEVLTLRSDCLDVRLRELKALTAALASPDAVERSVTAAWSLPTVDRCNDVVGLRRAPVREGSAADSEERKLSDQVLLLRSMVDSGQLAPAVEKAKGLLEKVRAQKSGALETSTLVQQGFAYQQLGKFAEAEATLRDAIISAEAVSRDDEMARAAFALAMVTGFHLHKPAEGRFFERYGSSALARFGGDPVIELEEQSASAVLLRSEDKPHDAVAVHEKALEAAKKLLGLDNPLLWRSYNDLATSLVNVKDFVRAVPLYEAALEVKRKTQGEDHPDIALLRSNLGNALFFVGRTEESFASLKAALAVRERILGADSLRLVPILNNLGDVETKAGRYADAEPHVTRAMALAQKAGPTHPNVFITGATMSELELASDRVPQAVKRLDDLLALQPQPPATVRVAVLGPRTTAALRAGDLKQAVAFGDEALKLEGELGKDSVDLVVPLLARGAAKLQLKDAAGGVADLERAVSISINGKAWAGIVADAKLALARGLLSTGGDAARVKTLATEARDAYAQTGFKPKQVAEAEALLK